VNGAPYRSFFVRQTEAAQEPPDRNPVDRDAVAIRQFDHLIVHGQAGLLDPRLLMLSDTIFSSP
jgi:hypothetical protein